jgi:hypothetical protein
MASKFIPLEEMKTTPEWIRLSNTYRDVVSAYLSNGYDREAAVATVFKCGTRRGLIATVCRVFGNADVRAFLSVHFGETERERFAEECRRVLNGKKISQQRLGALRILAKAQGINPAAVGELEAAGAKADEKVVAEKIIERDGKKYRTTVTEVSE